MQWPGRLQRMMLPRVLGKYNRFGIFENVPIAVFINSQGLADNAVIAKVDGVLWDLDRPLEVDCKLQLLKFDDPEGKSVFWHSSAHMLGEAMERMYGGCLCYGPPIENGFYYDMYLEDKGVSGISFRLDILLIYFINRYQTWTFLMWSL